MPKFAAAQCSRQPAGLELPPTIERNALASRNQRNADSDSDAKGCRPELLRGQRSCKRGPELLVIGEPPGETYIVRKMRNRTEYQGSPRDGNARTKIGRGRVWVHPDKARGVYRPAPFVEFPEPVASQPDLHGSVRNDQWSRIGFLNSDAGHRWGRARVRGTCGE